MAFPFLFRPRPRPRPLGPSLACGRPIRTHPPRLFGQRSRGVQRPPPGPRMQDDSKVLREGILSVRGMGLAEGELTRDPELHGPARVWCELLRLFESRVSHPRLSSQPPRLRLTGTAPTPTGRSAGRGKRTVAFVALDSFALWRVLGPDQWFWALRLGTRLLRREGVRRSAPRGT